MGLGMKGGVQTVELGNGLQGRAQRHRVVGRAERVTILEVDLVLAWCYLMMRRLDIDAELLQRVHHLASDGMRQVAADVEIAGCVVHRERLQLAVGTRLE